MVSDFTELDQMIELAFSDLVINFQQTIIFTLILVATEEHFGNNCIFFLINNNRRINAT